MLPGAGPASLSRRAPQTALRRTCQMAASGVCVEDRTAPQPGPLPRFHCLTLASLSQRLRGAEAQPSAEDDSRAWLSAHSLEFEKLTVADLVSQGAPVL